MYDHIVCPKQNDYFSMVAAIYHFMTSPFDYIAYDRAKRGGVPRNRATEAFEYKNTITVLSIIVITEKNEKHVRPQGCQGETLMCNLYNGTNFMYMVFVSFKN